MLIRAFLFLYFCAMALQGSAKAEILSDQAEIIVLILEPSQKELYTAFGHSAFRVYDPTQDIDLVFNYGIFDFNQPHFYLNFTKGKLYYKLGVATYRAYENYYLSTNRTFRELQLNLNQAQKQRLFDYLMKNAQPENASYYYNYCYDNCATRMRDVLQATLADRLHYNYSYAHDSLSFRALMDRYLSQQPWGDLGIDICLGSEIDRTATGWQYMYMPEYLEIALQGALIQTDSSLLPLVASSQTVYVGHEVVTPTLVKPIYVFLVVLFVAGLFTYRGVKHGVRYRGIDVVLLGTTGLLGCFLLFLWLGTDHLSQYNYNLMWAMPLNLPALFLLYHKKAARWLRFYFLAYGGLLLFLLFFRPILLQPIHYALMPLVLSLAIRSFYIAYSLAKIKH